MRCVNILLSLSFFLASPIMTSADRTHSAENHPADPSTLSSSASIDASVATPRSWRSTPGQNFVTVTSQLIRGQDFSAIRSQVYAARRRAVGYQIGVFQ
jgi:hypothetical protein